MFKNIKIGLVIGTAVLSFFSPLLAFIAICAAIGMLFTLPVLNDELKKESHHNVILVSGLTMLYLLFTGHWVLLLLLGGFIYIQNSKITEKIKKLKQGDTENHYETETEKDTI